MPRRGVADTSRGPLLHRDPGTNQNLGVQVMRYLRRYGTDGQPMSYQAIADTLGTTYKAVHRTLNPPQHPRSQTQT